MCETFWEISRKTDVAKFRIHKNSTTDTYLEVLKEERMF